MYLLKSALPVINMSLDFAKHSRSPPTKTDGFKEDSCSSAFYVIGGAFLFVCFVFTLATTSASHPILLSLVMVSHFSMNGHVTSVCFISVKILISRRWLDLVFPVRSCWESLTMTTYIQDQ